MVAKTPSGLGWVDTIDIVGYKLFSRSSGDEFVWKGLNYYPRPNSGLYDVNNFDFYTDEWEYVWRDDILKFKELGVNVVRLYAVSPSPLGKAMHNKFMCALSQLGIYVIIPVSAMCSGCEISSSNAPACYSGDVKSRAQRVIHEFASYPNVIAFEAGNEANQRALDAFANAPCQKALIRDMKRYIAGCHAQQKMRNIPVMVTVADKERIKTASYYHCSELNDEYDLPDIYGINVYLHCDYRNETSFSKAPGYQTLQSDFASLSLSFPVVLSEIGCLDRSFPAIGDYEGQRTWRQAKWLSEEPLLRNQFVGSCVSEFSTERAKAGHPFPFQNFSSQDYGLGHYVPANCDHVRIRCEYVRHPTFDYLKDAWGSAKEAKVLREIFNPSSQRLQASVSCPAGTSGPSDFSFPADSIVDLSCPDTRTVLTVGASTTCGAVPGLFDVDAREYAAASVATQTVIVNGSLPRSGLQHEEATVVTILGILAIVLSSAVLVGLIGTVMYVRRTATQVKNSRAVTAAAEAKSGFFVRAGGSKGQEISMENKIFLKRPTAKQMGDRNSLQRRKSSLMKTEDVPTTLTRPSTTVRCSSSQWQHDQSPSRQSNSATALISSSLFSSGSQEMPQIFEARLPEENRQALSGGMSPSAVHSSNVDRIDDEYNEKFAKYEEGVSGRCTITGDQCTRNRADTTTMMDSLHCREWYDFSSRHDASSPSQSEGLLRTSYRDRTSTIDSDLSASETSFRSFSIVSKESNPLSADVDNINNKKSLKLWSL